MEAVELRNIVVIYVELPVAINERLLLTHPQMSFMFAEFDTFSRDLEELFFKDKSHGKFIQKIAEGIFLADADAWHSNILAMMKWCGEKEFPYVIIPVGDTTTALSGKKQDVTQWLAEKGRAASE